MSKYERQSDIVRASIKIGVRAAAERRRAMNIARPAGETKEDTKEGLGTMSTTDGVGRKAIELLRRIQTHGGGLLVSQVLSSGGSARLLLTKLLTLELAEQVNHPTVKENRESNTPAAALRITHWGVARLEKYAADERDRRQQRTLNVPSVSEPPLQPMEPYDTGAARSWTEAELRALIRNELERIEAEDSDHEVMVHKDAMDAIGDPYGSSE